MKIESVEINKRKKLFQKKTNESTKKHTIDCCIHKEKKRPSMMMMMTPLFINVTLSYGRYSLQMITSE